MLNCEESKRTKGGSGDVGTEEGRPSLLGHAQVVEGLEGLRATLVDRLDATEKIDRLLDLLRQASKREEQVYSLLAQAPIGITIYHGPDHIIEFENLAHQQMFGRRPAKSNRGRRFADAYPEVAVDAPRYLGEVFREGGVRTVDQFRAVVSREPGEAPEELFLRLALMPLKKDDGSSWGVMSISLDVTDMVRCRERISEPYRRVVEQSSQLICVTDLACNTVFSNRAFLAFVGELQEPLLGTSGSCIHPVDLNTLRGASESHLRQGTSFRREVRLRRRDGVYVWHLLEVEPFKDERCKQTGWIAFASDIQRVKELAERAEAANRAKDAFLALLSHELRNPLAPMQTALQLMRLRSEGKNVRELDVIERQVRHLTRLVEDLLDVSRITSGKTTLERRSAPAAEVVARALEMASPLLEQRQHHVSVQMPPHDAMISGDPDRLAQVFSNLLSNAAKYTPPRGDISLTVDVPDSEMVVRVRDSGDGIAPELLPKLFELFSQGERTLARSEGGLGLGLAIVRNLVELHGGSVTARSEGPGRGSEFVVRLPRSNPNETLSPVVQSVQANSEPSEPRPKVLVVDDNEDSASMLSEALQELGCETETAFDGPSAVRAAKRFRPQVVLLDIGLPVMDGFEVARLLRQEPGLTPLKLVAITGYARSSDQEKGIEAGFDEHLAKPVDIDKLRELLELRSRKGPGPS